LVGACAQTEAPEPRPAGRTVALAPDTVRAAIAEELRRFGFAVVTDTTITGRSDAADPAWATCRDALVGDRTADSRRVTWAKPGARIATVEVATGTTDAATTVSVAARHAARYVDPFLALPFMRSCPSTGVLERRLLEAAG
jgi:hypothetical protein